MSNNPERQPGVEGGSVDYGQQLNEITNKINALSDENTENDNEARESLQKLLTDEFIGNLDKFLKSDEELRTRLQETLVGVLNSYTDKNDATYQSLSKLAGSIGLKENGGTWTKESSESPDPSPEKPTLGFTGKLEGIKTGEEGKEQKGSEGLYNGLKRDAPAEGENLDDNKNLYKTIQEINTQLSSVRELLGDSKLQGDEWLNKVKEGLELAQTVINYPTPDNVKILQKFISENLEGQDKTDFDRASKRGNDFDGKFGKGTLKGCNLILKKTEKYIKGMEDYLESLNDKENQDKVDKVKPKTNKTIKLGETIGAKDLVDGLEDGVEVSFATGEEEKLKEKGTPTVSLVVRCGDKENTIRVTVTVTENASDTQGATGTQENPSSTVEQTASNNTAPLTMENGKTYLVMGNSGTLTTNSGLSGSTFYCVDEYTGNKPGENEQWGTMEPPTSNEYECLMTLSNHPGEIYKVKVDAQGNLCPVMENYKSQIRILIENNESCFNYLMNKIPQNLINSSGINIDWSQNYNDYRITSYGRGLTIEPMEIDGGGISSNLSELLIMMNFSNFLRGNKSIDDIDFGKDENDGNDSDNPRLKLDDGNLYVRVDEKSNRRTSDGKTIKMGKRYLVPLERFGLDQINPNRRKQVFENFIKFNNKQEWSSSNDWDKKEENRYYKKMRI